MDKVIITESLCKQYQELDFICRMLKKNKNIAETWFFNGKLFIKHDSEDSHGIQITHISDLVSEFNVETINSILKR